MEPRGRSKIAAGALGRSTMRSIRFATFKGKARGTSVICRGSGGEFGRETVRLNLSASNNERVGIGLLAESDLRELTFSASTAVQIGFAN
jgi:hypothetical protein